MSCRLALAASLLAGACALGPGPEAGEPSPPADHPTPSAAPAPTPSPQPPPSPSPEPSPDPSPDRTALQQRSFDAERALEVATRLTLRVGPRPAGSDADEAARELVAALLAAAGWTVEEEPFPLPQGGESANLVAFLGEERPDGPYVLVGAHLDTVDGSPGANDNASGVGVLVALAELLADEPLAASLVLVGFGAEERQPTPAREHHIGSEHHAALYADRVVAMISVDMVGHGDSTCICWFDAGPDTLAVRLADVAGREELGGFHVLAAGDISDHGPFARRGAAAVLLWSGNDGRYHTPADTVEHLRVEDLRRAGDLTLAFLRDLGHGDVPELRRSS